MDVQPSFFYSKPLQQRSAVIFYGHTLLFIFNGRYVGLFFPLGPMMVHMEYSSGPCTLAKTGGWSSWGDGRPLCLAQLLEGQPGSLECEGAEEDVVGYLVYAILYVPDTKFGEEDGCQDELKQTQLERPAVKKTSGLFSVYWDVLVLRRTEGAFVSRFQI